VLAVPLTRRPLMPGILMPVRVRDERLVRRTRRVLTRASLCQRVRWTLIVLWCVARTSPASPQIAEIEDMRARGQNYVGAFLVKDTHAAAAAEADALPASMAPYADPTPANTAGAATGATPAAATESGSEAASTATPAGESASSSAAIGAAASDASAVADAERLHEVGTFAQVHNVIKMDDAGGAMLMLMGAPACAGVAILAARVWL
jgi:Lon-like ATP-dependent protease